MANRISNLLNASELLDIYGTPTLSEGSPPKTGQILQGPRLKAGQKWNREVSNAQ